MSRRPSEVFQDAKSKLESLERCAKKRSRGVPIATAADTVLRFHTAIRDALYAYSDDPTTADLPGEIAHYAASMVEDLIEGRMPPYVREVFFGRGRTGYGFEMREMAEAVSEYVAAARAGVINDRSSIATLAKIFGVRSTTVRAWCKHYPITIPQLPDKLGPLAALGFATYESTLREKLARWSEAYRASRGVKARRQRR